MGFHLSIKDEVAPAPKRRARLASIVSIVRAGVTTIALGATLAVVAVDFAGGDRCLDHGWEMMRFGANGG
jgi:hypothetical protein